MLKIFLIVFLEEEEELLDLDAARSNVEKQLQALQLCALKIQEHSEEADRSRRAIDSIRSQLDKERQSLHEVSGKLVSLSALQKAALTSDDESYQKWLGSQGLSHAPRLVQEIQVSSGWEIAADAILGEQLAGVIVESIDRLIPSDHQLSTPSLFLIQSGGVNDGMLADDSILKHVHSDRCDLRPLLSGVYVANTLKEALLRRSSLENSECVVTRDGIVLGSNWLRTPEDQNATHGILARGELIESFSLEKERLSSRIESQEKELLHAEETNQLAITGQRAHQEESDKLQEDLADVRHSLAGKEARVAQIHTRSDQLLVESDELIKAVSYTHLTLPTNREV